MHNTITGVDLAKYEIQVCVTKAKKVRTNDAMTPSKFTQWLAKSKPMTIVFEACATSNYWYQSRFILVSVSRRPSVLEKRKWPSTTTVSPK